MQNKVAQNNVLWAQKANSGVGGVLSIVAMGIGRREMGQSPKKWWGVCEWGVPLREIKNTCAARLTVGGDYQSCSRRISFFSF